MISQQLRRIDSTRHGPLSRRGGCASIVALVLTLMLTLGCHRAADPTGVAGPVRPAAGGDAAERVSAEPIRAVATVGMVAELVRHVGGDHVHVTQLMGSGVDPHLYRVTRDDVRHIFASEIVLASGLLLEGKMNHALQRMAQRRRLVEVAAEILRRCGGDAGGGGPPAGAKASRQHDPHVWMDVSLWAEGTAVVADALARQRPELEESFRRNAARYRQRLLALHRWGREVMATVPPRRRQLVTSHDAFGYFGRAYGLSVTGVQGLATDSEAGVRRINRLVDLLVDQGITAVFVESSISPKSVQAVIEGAAARGHRVRIGGQLYSDACGPCGTYPGTYFGMMDHNITIIARALGGQVPAGGFQGQLAISSGVRVEVRR